MIFYAKLFTLLNVSLVYNLTSLFVSALANVWISFKPCSRANFCVRFKIWDIALTHNLPSKLPLSVFTVLIMILNVLRRSLFSSCPFRDLVFAWRTQVCNFVLICMKFRFFHLMCYTLQIIPHMYLSHQICMQKVN